MAEYKLTEAEEKFAEIIWENEPIKSSELVRLSEKAFDWEKSTTYTMLKKLEIKKVFTNNNGIVASLLSKEELYAEQSKQIVKEVFDGSFPRFLAAFTRDKLPCSTDNSEFEMFIIEHK